MKLQLGAMSVGDILDRGLKLLLARLGTFYLLNLLIQSPSIIFRFLAPDIDLDSGPKRLAYILLSIVCSFVAMGAVLKVIEQEHIGHRVGIGEALGFALSRSVQLIGSAFVYIFVVGVCLLPAICVVGVFATQGGAPIAAIVFGVLVALPALAVAMMYALQSQAVALENHGPITGLGRSRELTSGYRWRILVIVLMKYILTIIVTIVMAFAMIGLPFDRTNISIRLTVETLSDILFGTYSTICLTLAYFDLRTRKEGFDLELAAQGLPQTGRDEYDDDDDRRRDGGADYFDRRPRRDDDWDDRPRTERD